MAYSVLILVILVDLKWTHNFDLCMYNDNEHFFVHAYWLFLDLLQSDSYSVNLLI